MLRINDKGFTFGQIAAILLVVLGLAALIVLLSSQISGAGENLGSVSQNVGEATSGLNFCEAVGGTCTDTCSGNFNDAHKSCVEDGSAYDSTKHSTDGYGCCT